MAKAEPIKMGVTVMPFPLHRMRRLRQTPVLRDMVAETALSARDFIYPIFVAEGSQVDNPIGSMPGVSQLSIDKMLEEANSAFDLGVPAVLLFGLPAYKDEMGSEAYSENALIARATAALKKNIPRMLVVTDVCFCEYTSHGHCGYINEKGEIDNDITLDMLAKEALAHARAGADIVAPSDMMDGRIGHIRAALDDAGFKQTIIMSYAAKYASNYYGPFREAAECAPQFGDRKAYQMDFRNASEALREVALDIEEGADIVMVKPALAYLDVLRMVKDEFGMPTAAYNVSGEFSMIKAAGAKGWINEELVMMETLTAMKRAGADMIITYFAKDAARLLRQG